MSSNTTAITGVESQVTTITLTNPPAPAPEMTNLRRAARRSADEGDNFEIPLVDPNLGTGSDIEFINGINQNGELISWRRAVLNAIAGDTNQPNLFPTIIREMDLRTTRLVAEIVSSPITPNTLRPLTNLVSIAFALGYSDTNLIVQDIISNMPDLSDGPDYQSVLENLNRITERATEEHKDANERAQEEIEKAAEAGRNERNRILSRFGIRLAIGSGIFAAAGALMVAVIPRVMSSTSISGMLGDRSTTPTPNSDTTPDSGFFRSLNRMIGGALEELGKFIKGDDS